MGYNACRNIHKDIKLEKQKTRVIKNFKNVHFQKKFIQLPFSLYFF